MVAFSRAFGLAEGNLPILASLRRAYRALQFLRHIVFLDMQHRFTTQELKYLIFELVCLRIERGAMALALHV